MTYKAKFEASEHRAHYQNIATKILREMSILRSLVESSPIAPRRWVWELIQNAKDVHAEEGVKIRIEYQPDISDPFISFKHNGKPFTADNIRFLIEQISTKDRKKDEDGKRKTTGKFGTGFLTTHLLSETVTVKGVAKEPELDYRKFQLELDRTGFEIEQITDAVQIAKTAVQDMDDFPTYSEYIDGEFNTEFLYPLADSVSLRVAKSGLEDLDNCLPYTLAFVKEIKSIEILPSNLVYTNIIEEIKLAENLSLVSVFIDKGSEIKERNVFTIAFLNKGLTSIALPVKKENEKIFLLSINEQTPRLYCDFPLIGTEKFHFPVIINNPNFNPTDSRDGVFLTTPQRTNPLIEENKIIMQEAVELYFELLEFAIENKWEGLHLLAQIRSMYDLTDWIDDAWFKADVLNPIRKKLLYAHIVNNSNGELSSILTEEGENYIWFPSSGSKGVRSQIWQLANYWFPHCLPQQSDVELWYKLSWNECGKLDVDQFAAFLENKETLKELSEVLGEKDVYEWLNDFYLLLTEEDKEYDIIINKRAIFPNQNGFFCKRIHLKRDMGNIGDDFKDILGLLGRDIRNELADEKIEIEFEIDDFRDLTFVVNEINSEVNEKASDREVAKGYSEAFKKLLRWFQEQPEKAKSLFPILYKNKHLLYDDDEILENISKAEQLADLLKDCNASSITELRELIAKGQNNSTNLLPVTQEILLSMGISSTEEWAEAIKDKDLAAMFSHESTPTTDMFIYVQSLIKKAKENIIQHLQTLRNYDLKLLDDSTATTILAGIQKDGQDISIVARPAYAGEVIIYYGSERDVLDYEPSELWIDDGIIPRRISLGHILKKAQIIKFPI
jgi:hypothetical protein